MFLECGKNLSSRRKHPPSENINRKAFGLKFDALFWCVVWKILQRASNTFKLWSLWSACIYKSILLHPEEDVNVWTTFQGQLSDRCWDVSVRTEVTDPQRRSATLLLTSPEILRFDRFSGDQKGEREFCFFSRLFLKYIPLCECCFPLPAAPECVECSGNRCVRRSFASEKCNLQTPELESINWK